MALTIGSNVYDITKTMIESGEVDESEDLSLRQIINRLFRWFVTEDGQDIEDAIQSTIEWLDNAGVEQFSDDEEENNDAVKELCMTYVDKKGNVAKLVRVEKAVEFYQNEIEELQQLPSEYRRALFGMLVHTKVMAVQGKEEPNKLYYGIRHYHSYCSGAKLDRIDAYKYLYDNKWLTVSPDNFAYYYFVKEFSVEENERPVVTTKKFDKESLTELYYKLFGKEWERKNIMVVDLLEDEGYEDGFDSLADVEKELTERGRKVTKGTIRNLYNFYAYSASDYTFVDVKHNNDIWKHGAERFMRSLQGSATKVKKNLKEVLRLPKDYKPKIGIDYSEMSFLKNLMEDLVWILGTDDRKIKWCIPKKDRKTKQMVREKSIISQLREKQLEQGQQERKIEVPTLEELKERETRLMQQCSSSEKSIISQLRERQQREE